MMTANPRQDKRAAVLTTAKEMDFLVVTRFDGTESVSDLFEFRLEAQSETEDIDFDELLGKHMTLTLKSIKGMERKFDGILTQAQWLGVTDHSHTYALTLRPWFWILSHRSDNFIFHDKNVCSIVKEVFGRHSFASFDDRTSGDFPVMEYCVQYNETDFAFVSRLLEEFGITYFFEHEENAHKLVLVNDNSGFEPVTGSSRPYRSLAGHDRRLEESFDHWTPTRQFRSGKITVRDYNFKTPRAKMQGERFGIGSYEHSDQELYHYPGRFDKQGDGNLLASLRMQAKDALDKRCIASGNCITLMPGLSVTMTDHPAPSQCGEYVVLQASHSFTSQSYRSGATGMGETTYEGRFELLSSDVPFKPQQVTRKTSIYGPQTALVVGKDGEEIDCDEYGRILVRFYWDRQNDQSMRCRVGQTWASAKWGGMVIPRIGMEVIVEFLDGDPDKPLVTGCLYNADNMPPNQLPDYKTRSIFKSASHKGSGFNEIRFEDESGEEEIWVHAQKYLNTVIEEDETRSVSFNRDTQIGASDSVKIAKDKDLEIGGSRRQAIKGSEHLSVIGARTSKVSGNDVLSVGSSYRVEAGMAQHFEAGASVYIKSGTSVVIESGATICLQAGGNFITISPAGIQIQGTMVMLNCGGSPLTGSEVPSNEPDPVAGPHAERYSRSYKL
ncbi:type VI secretion system Vgr family protein [Rhizobium laguerreae]|uniref:type VI secretion system Vgr family protein n=1 Tax=Rhizobium laguerreae TaxID=1076926 RepID=UPI001C912F66|nr:type VI secretion system tip protein TssI/VgrG [Rhizobium laguerreae]MBY3347995.1 type VI secretion system tip protein VgrG [Rhizobium laguerreae]MBY3354958.1 type VI secretion system tip protein VgrG [Rhizobium laguerreae]MBY3376263.1 type VI secretion system tip protein VgrG [Rhizobium laguerreae]MBY3431262.1 type VI secretion system tip protein VgrG [Rhizobium laguerreae]MBY3439877.1 type VI secretion system tip protein VgrG [Rhizobium laguerreae]